MSATPLQHAVIHVLGGEQRAAREGLHGDLAVGERLLISAAHQSICDAGEGGLRGEERVLEGDLLAGGGGGGGRGRMWWRW